MPVIVKMSYTYSADPKEWAAAYTDERAKMFLAVPGLIWKIWLDEPNERLSGGIFLFETREYAEAYLASPLGSRAKHNPKLSDLRIELFEIREEMTRITHGPVPFKLPA